MNTADLRNHFVAVAFSAWLVFTPLFAEAHAIITDSEPAVNAAVAGGDVTIKLRFNSRLDFMRSKLTLIHPDQSVQPLTLQPQDAPDVLLSEATGLMPGDYRLRWQVLSIDGHITRGDIPFTVQP